ncbi:hypothetical protein NQ318_015591 [Aromia moschata]|uniref:Uncharacterized protein n=1 Tax=Aromia moschata TaxID=1265417 RepID=A0AAV8X4H5_9CUCU|nr:hypothetical protein NQ318_015591 [Aromia moschata]
MRKVCGEARARSANGRSKSEARTGPYFEDTFLLYMIFHANFATKIYFSETLYISRPDGAHKKRIF